MKIRFSVAGPEPVATRDLEPGSVYSLEDCPNTRYLALHKGSHGAAAVNLCDGRVVMEATSSSLRWVLRPNAELVDGPR